MNNFPVKIGDKEYWISRSVAAAGFIIRKDDNGELRVLACQRGHAVDYEDFWCCPCGYLDYDETIAQCCSREIYEETGISLSTIDLHLFGINDDPTDSIRQNITFKFYSIVPLRYNTSDSFVTFRSASDEVKQVCWIPISKLDYYKWAFGHKEIILNVIETYLK